MVDRDDEGPSQGPNIGRDLAALAGRLHLSWGRTSRQTQGDLMVLIKALPRAEGRMDHLVLFHAGFPVPREVQEIPLEVRDRSSRNVVHRGKTDRLGQVRVEGLRESDYEVVLPLYRPVARLALAGLGTPRPTNPYHEEGPIRWRSSEYNLEGRAVRRIDIRVQPEPEPEPDNWAPVVLFRIAHERLAFLCDGLVGIYFEEGSWYGESILELQHPMIQSDPTLKVQLGGFRRLTRTAAAAIEPETYQRAIGATLHRRCVEALENAQGAATP